MKKQAIQPLKKAFLVFVLILALFSILNPVHAAWYNSSWLYRKAITIDSSKVSATLSNFPVLVSIASDSDLASKAQSDANDILFTLSDGTTKLAHEIEDFNSATGKLIAWVKVPSLSSSTDTTLYMYYGNSSASSQQDAVNVWDANYVMVQHLDESPANDVAGHIDSTSNNNDGTPKNFDGTSTSTTDGTGKINGGDVFDGTDDYVDTALTDDLSGGGAFSVFAWVKDIPAGNQYVIAQSHQLTPSYASDWILGYWNGGLWFRGTQINGSDVISDGSWHLIGFTFDGTTAKLYIDGGYVGSSTPAGFGGIGSVKLMTRGDATSTFTSGTIDSVCISNKARSANWIATEYNNQSSPSTFYSLGSEEVQASGNAPTITLNNPNGNQVIGATYSVDFNVNDADNDQLGAALYYSENSNDFNYLIADLNLNDYSNYPGLSCDSSIWLVSTNCTYDWNLYRLGVSVKD